MPKYRVYAYVDVDGDNPEEAYSRAEADVEYLNEMITDTPELDYIWGLEPLKRVIDHAKLIPPEQLAFEGMDATKEDS